MRRKTGTLKILVSEIDYSRAPCLGDNQKVRGLWEQDWSMCLIQTGKVSFIFNFSSYTHVTNCDCRST